MTRIFLLGAVLLLSACGGGGGGAPVSEPPVTPPPVVAPPPVNFAAVAGEFEAPASATSTATVKDSQRGAVNVHSDGTIVGTLWRHQEGVPSFTWLSQERLTFSGSLSTGAITYTYTFFGGTYGSVPFQETTRHDAGTIEAFASNVDGAPGITVRFPDSVPFSAKSFTLARKPVPAAYIGLPLAKLGGWLQFSLHGESTDVFSPGMYHALVHHDAATGVITGSFSPQCHIAGKLYGYDPATGTMRQDWTVAGSNCPVAGTSQMVGQLLPGAALGTRVAGVMHGKWMLATISHPLAALQMPFGAIAGAYDVENRPHYRAELQIHPDGLLRMTVISTSSTFPVDVDTGTFVGRLVGDGSTLRATGELAVLHQRWAGTRRVYSHSSGTATVDLTQWTQHRPTLTVRMAGTVAPPVAEFDVIMRSRWSLGQPIERLAGAYDKGVFTTGSGPSCDTAACTTPMQVQLDAAGHLSGAVLPNCQLSGRILDYNPPFGVFRHEATLQGGGCPVSGTATLLGTVGFSGGFSPNLLLQSSGVLGGQPVALVLVHATNKP